MGTRIAFVVNAFASDIAGFRDTPGIFDRLINPELGGCSNTSQLVHDCKTREEFQNRFDDILKDWKSADQLILYFAGHGVYCNDQYALNFGTSNLAFAGIFSSIRFHGITRAIIILDTCHSGAATKQRSKPDGLNPFPIGIENLPKGIAIVGACRSYEKANDMTDGSYGLFTKLVIEAIDSGLGNTTTQNDRISIEDLLRYIKSRMSDDEYSMFDQHPIFEIYGAEADIWISANKTKKTKHQQSFNQLPALRSSDELHIAYEKTSKSLHPCIGATSKLLCWELVKQFAKKYKEYLEEVVIYDDYSDSLLLELGLYSELSNANPKELHNAAVLCFCNEPQRFFRNARAVLLIGEIGQQKRYDIQGPITKQFRQLYELITEKLDDIDVTGKDGYRTKQKEIPIEVIREAVSNAITHRDYSLPGHIVVNLTSEELILSSPGGFPNGVSWERLFDATDPLSIPRDEAIAIYTTFLLTFEGVGQGFREFRKFREKFGKDSITYQELDGPTAQIKIKRRQTEVGSLPTSPSPILEQGLDLKGYSAAIQKRLEIVEIYGLDAPSSLQNLFIPQTVCEVHEYNSQLLGMPENEQTRKLKQPEAPTTFRQILDVIDDESCKNVVILGVPGSGKSALSNFLALRWSRIKDDHNRNSMPVPILIKLRNYNQWNCPSGKSLIRYLQEASTWFRLKKQILDHLLTQPKGALMILDGLDEVVDHSQRELVINDIHRLSSENPHLRLIVTTRPTTYQPKWFRSLNFRHFKIQEFNSNQRKSFLVKWFSHILGGEKRAQQESHVLEGLIERSASLKTIAGNPLLLSMIVATHCYGHDQGGCSITELYKNMTEVLLQHKDSERGMTSKYDYRTKIRILHKIAYAMTNQSLNMITQDSITQLIRENLAVEFQFTQSPTAANEILRELCDRNSILYFSDGGYVRFSHRSFLDFFCADYFANRINIEKTFSIDQLVDYCDVHSENGYWREILRLICELLNDRDIAVLIDKLLCKVELQILNEQSPESNILMALLCLSQIQEYSSKKELIEHLVKLCASIFQKSIDPLHNYFIELIAAVQKIDCKSMNLSPFYTKVNWNANNSWAQPYWEQFVAALKGN